MLRQSLDPFVCLQSGNLTSNFLFLHAVFTLQLALVSVTSAAPAVMTDSELTRVMEAAKSLVRKVLSDIPAVHESCVSSQVSDVVLASKTRPEGDSSLYSLLCGVCCYVMWSLYISCFCCRCQA